MGGVKRCEGINMTSGKLLRYNLLVVFVLNFNNYRSFVIQDLVYMITKVKEICN